MKQRNQKTLFQKMTINEILNILSICLDWYNIFLNKESVTNEHILEELQLQNKKYLEILIDNVSKKEI